ncbi:MAG: InlB B-repeat-containing protein [Clostridiales bacterium]|nr:InlB B-repeat-containing protein [Clostridiales bacterium]
MIKRKIRNKIRSFVSTVLTASIILSIFQGGILYADPEESSHIPSEGVVSSVTEPEEPEDPTEETTGESEPSETVTDATDTFFSASSDDPSTESSSDEDEETTSENLSESTSENKSASGIEPTGENTSGSGSEPTGETTSESTSVPTSESTTESTTESTSESTSESATESTSESATDSSSENTSESSSETTPPPSEETTSESASDPQEPSESYIAVLQKTITDHNGHKYSFTATYDTAESGLPKDAELDVKEITGGNAYDAYLEEVQATLDSSDLDYVHLFDITIVKDGVELQPAEGAKVSVEIKLEDTESEDLSIVHFAEEPGNGSAELIECSTTNEGDATIVAFDAESFSVYAVVDHEQQTVLVPRVMFHFIADGATSATDGTTVFYEGAPYQFKNKSQYDNDNMQKTQILADGESLEQIVDPINREYQYFYGWYLVDPYINADTDDYGIGTSNGHLYYTWPQMPSQITFESPISITESEVSIGDTIHWSLNGLSGTGSVDADGNVHVFLAPVYEKYNFINFMLYPRNANSSGASNLMTRKMVALGSSTSVDVKVSDVRSTSTDPVHLVFTGWEYNAGTEDNPNWIQVRTVEYDGSERKDPGKDGTYITVDLADTTSVDLYPIFVEARWVDFFSGISGSGAKYVASRFLESWGTATPANTQEESNKNIFTTLNTTTRAGYSFEGWYAFAVIDPNTGEILNLNTPMDVQVTYIDVNNKFQTHTVTVHTTALKISDENGNISFQGDCCLVDNGNGTYGIGSSGTPLLFGEGNTSNSLRLYDAVDRLTLYANWVPSNTEITIVYWTEKAQEKGYQAPADPKDDYAATAVKVINTSELNSQSASIGATFTSGSTLTLNQLKEYKENSVGVIDPAYLDEVEAVHPGEEKFYQLNEETGYSTQSVVIKGDGSTVINVYFSRIEFKVVFHIGRDGYVKQNGQQRPEYMTRPAYQNWDGNWIQFMFNDSHISDDLGYTPGPTAKSYSADFTMTYHNPYTGIDEVYTTGYVTNADNVLGDYVPADSEDVYVITAKYGAYIGDRWPTPVNPYFDFTHDSSKSMYIWAGYYGSLYCGIAHSRGGADNNNNPDINGIYEYMSAELCSNRDGTDVINANHVHHLVAYYGDTGKAGIIKHYHIYFEAIDGTYDPNSVTTVSGNDFLGYSQTTWSAVAGNGDVNKVANHLFYLESDADVISNLDPKAQLGSTLDGYNLVYSCYNTLNTNEYHVYFFYTPKQYTLTFKYEDQADWKTDTYYYTQSLANAKKPEYADPQKEGYEFLGWYTNEFGLGEPFDFANETMPSDNDILYPVMRVIQYRVQIDPNGGEIDHINNSSVSTYFTADYGTTIGEYSVSRDYIALSDKDLQTYTGTKYYYLNTQFNELYDGDWGLHPNLRNALYLTEADLQDYYNNVYVPTVTNNLGYYTGVTLLSFDDFAATYTSYPTTAYRPVNPASEHYSFMGWYQVFDDGSVASMPYNFNDPVYGPITLRALWRLDGGYYLQYNPYYFEEDNAGHVTIVAGEMEAWLDPERPSVQLYADQSLTHILRAPTNITSGWIFRGWRVVKAVGETTYTDDNGRTYNVTEWEPIQYDDNGDVIYYQPGDDFIVNSDLVTEVNGVLGSVIHLQAYYEMEDHSYRRPEITNLILDANDPYGGYVNQADSTMLPELSGSGSQIINMNSEIYNGYPTQILLGDIQSNISLHLYRYATNKTFFGIPGTNFFTNENGYLLIGFDENSDPNSPTTGDAYVPAFAPDTVIAVQRDENHTLYAMWEPMVYATFVNTTDKPITITLTGSGVDTVSVVNQVTGEFDRAKTTNTIVVPPRSGNENGSIKVVFPHAEAGVDSFTATAENDHLTKKMSVSGEYPTGTAYGTGSEDKLYGQYVTYTGTLVTDATGIVVTYTEEPEAQVIFDVNGGTWTDGSPFVLLSGDLYAIKETDVVNNNYEPSDPTHGDLTQGGKIFIGWTDNPDIAANTDFSSTSAVTFGSTTITPDTGSIVLEKVKSDYLWDFNQTPPYNHTLYAVWSDAVTVTFDVCFTSNENANTVYNHIWNSPATVNGSTPYEFCANDAKGRYITYTMAKGEKVPKPDDPTAIKVVSNAAEVNPEWHFIKWLVNNNTTDSYRYTSKDPNLTNLVTYGFDFSQPITENITLSTSWTQKNPQVFTFTIENHVVGGNVGDEFDYTIAISGEMVDKSNKLVDVDHPWGSVTTKLKDGQTYTVRITVYSIQPGGWSNPGYGSYLEIVDADGVVVSSSPLLQHSALSQKYYSSSYSYNLTITQEAKEGYETTVEDGTSAGTIDYTTNSENRSFTFAVAHGQKFPTNVNAFDEGASNSLTIIFTNTGKYIAPSGIRFNVVPFLMTAGIGVSLGLASVFGRRRKKEEFDGEAPEGK